MRGPNLTAGAPEFMMNSFESTCLIRQVNKNFDVDGCRMDPKQIAGSSRARVEGGGDVIRLKNARPSGYLRDREKAGR